MVKKLTPTQRMQIGERELITNVLTKDQLKSLRAKPLPERNKIIQDKLAEIQRQRLMKLRMMKNQKRFVF